MRLRPADLRPMDLRPVDMRPRGSRAVKPQRPSVPPFVPHLGRRGPRKPAIPALSLQMQGEMPGTPGLRWRGALIVMHHRLHSGDRGGRCSRCHRGKVGNSGSIPPSGLRRFGRRPRPSSCRSGTRVGDHHFAEARSESVADTGSIGAAGVLWAHSSEEWRARKRDAMMMAHECGLIGPDGDEGAGG